MSAVTIRGTPHPVVLPKLTDPRLHLAAVITTLQVLGQVAFHFRLSIAQILVSLLTCAVLEVGITLRRQHVLMWPASALLTGNGVAFILRVPGTQHGDWWSMNGWWIFMATAAVSLLSKYVIVWRGGHVFNPSNFGLVLCFLVLGRTRAEPLDFWWGPMSWWMALALAVILAGGFAILSRLRLLWLALAFWATFAAGIATLAAAGHEMTARWHLGPLSGFELWWVLVTSPKVLVFLFFMITDPKTAPLGGRTRVVYAASIGLLAALLIAPTRTEYAAKVGLLAALALVCAVKPFLLYVPRRRLVLVAATAAVIYPVALVAVGNGPGRATAAPVRAGSALPMTIERSRGVQTQLDRPTGAAIARGLLAAVPAPAGARLRVHLEPGSGQSPPVAVAQLAGRTYRLSQAGARWALQAAAAPHQASRLRMSPKLAGVRLEDVAPSVGLDFQQGSFRYGVTPDYRAMMGGGVCWLDFDGDGWLDLFAVNSYASSDSASYESHGGLPESMVFRNDHGAFHAVHTGLHVQGDGCAAADPNGDGRPDLVVTTTSGVEVLWNDGGGHFAEQILRGSGWYAGVAIADVNGDGRPDVFAAGYTDPSQPVPGSLAGFPTNLTGIRDLLFLNTGGRTFREAGAQAGLEAANFDHGLGATFVDVNHDGRPDLYVANDEDPNRLYVNVPWPGGPAGAFRRRDPGGAPGPVVRKGRGPEPPLRERALARRAARRPARPRVQVRRARDPRGRRRPERRHGYRDRRPRRPARPARDELAQPEDRRIPAGRRALRRRPAALRPGPRDGVRRVGRLVRRPREFRAAGPRPRRRRDPRHEPRGGRGAAARARAVTQRLRRGGARARRRRAGAERPRPRGRGHGERRPPRGCRQHDRRKARAPTTAGARRPLARRRPVAVRRRRDGHRDARRRRPTDADDGVRVQLPLVRGSSGAFRARRDRPRRPRRSAAPVGDDRDADERSRRPDHHGRRAPAAAVGRSGAVLLGPRRVQDAGPEGRRPLLERRGRRRAAHRRGIGARAGAQPLRRVAGDVGGVAPDAFLRRRQLRRLPAPRLARLARRQSAGRTRRPEGAAASPLLRPGIHLDARRLARDRREPHRRGRHRRRPPGRVERGTALRGYDLRVAERAARALAAGDDGARPDVLAAARARAHRAAVRGRAVGPRPRLRRDGAPHAGVAARDARHEGLPQGRARRAPRGGGHRAARGRRLARRVERRRAHAAVRGRGAGAAQVARAERRAARCRDRDVAGEAREPGAAARLDDPRRRVRGTPARTRAGARPPGAHDALDVALADAGLAGLGLGGRSVRRRRAGGARARGRTASNGARRRGPRGRDRHAGRRRRRQGPRAPRRRARAAARLSALNGPAAGGQTCRAPRRQGARGP